MQEEDNSLYANEVMSEDSNEEEGVEAHATGTIRLNVMS